MQNRIPGLERPPPAAENLTSHDSIQARQSIGNNHSDNV